MIIIKLNPGNEQYHYETEEDWRRALNKARSLNHKDTQEPIEYLEKLGARKGWNEA